MIEPPVPAGFFAHATATGLAADLRAGRTSALALTRHALESIDSLDEDLHAFVTVDAEGALAAAERADRERADGASLGPLHGLPVAVKDIIDTAGLRTTMGSRHFSTHVPDQDAQCVDLLRRCGAIVVGKTTTHEFAYGPTGDRSATGATRNPYDHTRMSGGSSGGSAAAVAAGMVPLSVGTDTGGSVRIPAALCGLVGLKPTFGAIPTVGVFPLAPTLDHVGVLARTAADARLLLSALTPAGGGRPAGPADPAVPGRVRVGWVPPELFGPVDPRVCDLARAGATAAAGDGGEVVETAVAGVEEMQDAFAAIQRSEAYAEHADRVAAAPELYDAEVLDRLVDSAEIRGWEYVRASAARRRLTEAVSHLLREYDVLALPTVPVVAPPVGDRSVDVGGTRAPVRSVLLSLTSPWNLVGFPAVSVPTGLVHDLPAALQLVAAPGCEQVLLTLAERLQVAAQHGSGSG